jgi:hypothetical protein
MCALGLCCATHLEQPGVMSGWYFVKNGSLMMITLDSWWARAVSGPDRPLAGPDMGTC